MINDIACRCNGPPDHPQSCWELEITMLILRSNYPITPKAIWILIFCEGTTSILGFPFEGWWSHIKLQTELDTHSMHIKLLTWVKSFGTIVWTWSPVCHPSLSSSQKHSFLLLLLLFLIIFLYCSRFYFYSLVHAIICDDVWCMVQVYVFVSA